jgi:hypothetical protein
MGPVGAEGPVLLGGPADAWSVIDGLGRQRQELGTA